MGTFYDVGAGAGAGAGEADPHCSAPSIVTDTRFDLNNDKFKLAFITNKEIYLSFSSEGSTFFTLNNWSELPV